MIIDDDAQTHRPPSKPVRLPAPGKAGGFILIYSLWMLAAATVLLALLPGLHKGKVESSQIQAALEQRQAVNALDYLLRYSRGFNAVLDPRLDTYNRVLQAKARTKASGDERIALLKAMLDAMNFKINLDDHIKNSTSQDSSVSVGKEPGGADGDSQVNQPRIYTPRKKPYALRVGTVDFSLLITPANAKPNLNKIERKALLRYLVYLGMDQREAATLGDVIGDWVDADDETATYGAEKNYYNSLRPPYPPRNAEITSWGELSYLKGVTPELVRFLRKHFTLYGASGSVQAEESAPEALAALAKLPIQSVQKILRNHAKGDKPGESKELVFDDESLAFGNVATWTPEKDWVHIRVESPHAVAEAEYNLKSGVVVQWWLD